MHNMQRSQPISLKHLEEHAPPSTAKLQRPESYYPAGCLQNRPGDRPLGISEKHRDEFQLVFSDQPARLNSDKRELSETTEHLWKLGDKADRSKAWL